MEIVTLLAEPLSATDVKVSDVCENVMPVVMIVEPNVMDVVPAATAPKLVPWTVMRVAANKWAKRKTKNEITPVRAQTCKKEEKSI